MAKKTENDHLKQFGLHLKMLRKSKKLSLRKLALKCDIEHADIARYEKGEINMTFLTMVELAKGLEVPLKELMDF
jgi:transcriptional regulator with XRE-family HTH domain